MVANGRNARGWRAYVALGVATACCLSLGVLGQAEADNKSDGTNSSNAEASNYQRGSEALPFAVNVQGAETPQERAAEHAEEVKTHDTDQRWTIGIGIVTIITGLGAVAAAIWLVIVTTRLHAATRALAESTEDLARAGLDQVGELKVAGSLAAKQLGVSLEQVELYGKQLDLANKQFLLTGKQTDLTESEHALQRRKFLAENRPRIGIRNIGINRPKHGFLFEPSVPIEGGLVIWNAGACDARILEAKYRFYMSQHGLPITPPFEDGVMANLLPELPFTLKGHGSQFVPIRWGSQGLRVQSIPQGIERIYLMGLIRYDGGVYDIRDDTMDESYMGFCRQYWPPDIMGGDGRFEPVDDPNYEFSD